MGWWYGATPEWCLPLERDARRRFGPLITWRYERDRLTYWIRELEIAGDTDLVTLEIRFYRKPLYPMWGQRPEDFPRVFAKPGERSKHRHIDDALCLWYPYDPPERRWTSDKGLLDLIEISRRHLFMEAYWRDKKVWLLDDAPHGLTKGG